ncbi:MAG: c-type cytochrome [Opitutaceae bacterium]|nr:c-type cytochrome [Opitutaceae bacterium]
MNTRSSAQNGFFHGMRLRCLLAALWILAAGALAAPVSVPLEIPSVSDERIQIALFADAPDIVTPIGAAVDSRGRLFVLESHTHLPATNYAGPKRDRIKIFEGIGSDGRAERVSVFTDSVFEGMNLAFAPDGTLFVITAKTIEVLPDCNDDGKADEARVILRLETEEKYPHSQLLGITISTDGWVYAARGNTGGHPHAWIGADGRRLEAYGNGGDIVRCRLDGTLLERFAEGFWNPFDLKFDRHGRLLCVDNDPDSRGPNRLLHIVQGGDYGFKSLYGVSGLHPYIAWDGELPGTLPMIAGIGESPGGVLDLSFAALPEGYRDTIAVTIWGEHAVSIVRPTPVGVSLRGTAESFIRGGKWFRPVAIAAAPDGTIYITDWVLKDYPNHGQGRIWRLTTREGVATVKPAAPAPRVERSPVAGEGKLADLLAALKATDPFVRHAAGVALARSELRSAIERELESADPALRLGALIALRRVDASDAETIIRPRLRDTDEHVRLMALIWAGEKELRTLKPEIEATATLPGITPRFFETWLATLQILNAPAPARDAKRPAGFRIKRDVDHTLLAKIAADGSRPVGVRAFALRRLAGRAGALDRDVLSALVRTGDLMLRIEALRMLAEIRDTNAMETLRTIASNRGEPARVRAEAIVLLGAAESVVLTPLLDDPEKAVRTQAARTLRRSTQTIAPPPADAAAEWVKLLAVDGNPEAGERVFFAPTSTCVQCHRVNGRGGIIGPDLSVIGRAARRDQIIRSIVSPSQEIAPQFQGWEVTTKSGEVFTGLQGHWRSGGAASLILLDGRDKVVPAGQIGTFRALPHSLMPAGLAAAFSIEEFRDLAAYLEHLK